MKRNLILLLLLVGGAILLNCDIAFGQSRTNTLSRPCAGASTKARVEILRGGDIDLVPCSGKDVKLNGSTLSAVSLSGASRTGYFPYFSSQTNLAKSGFAYANQFPTTSTYIFDNDNLNATYQMVFRATSVADNGLFSVGNTTNNILLSESDNPGLSMRANHVFIEGLNDSGVGLTLRAAAGGDIVLDSPGLITFTNAPTFDGSAAGVFTVPYGTTPANPCQPGQIYIGTDSYLYVCEPGSSTWYRVALTEAFP